MFEDIDVIVNFRPLGLKASLSIFLERTNYSQSVATLSLSFCFYLLLFRVTCVPLPVTESIHLDSSGRILQTDDFNHAILDTLCFVSVKVSRIDHTTSDKKRQNIFFCVNRVFWFFLVYYVVVSHTCTINIIV